ncbi:hypothetical protein VOLCADRAFT_119087, partial [Volvox carteri f. nagariensis]
MVSVAFDIAAPSQQFLSDLYDACVLSVTACDDVALIPGDNTLVESASEEAGSGDAASQLRATCTAAALHYLSQQDARVIQQFLDAFFLPLLARSGTLPDKACQLQTCTVLVDLLIARELWPQLRQLIGACVSALDAAATGACGAGTGASSSGGGCRLPLRVACTLLAAVVQRLSS